MHANNRSNGPRKEWGFDRRLTYEKTKDPALPDGALVVLTLCARIGYRAIGRF